MKQIIVRIGERFLNLSADVTRTVGLLEIWDLTDKFDVFLPVVTDHGAEIRIPPARAHWILVANGLWIFILDPQFEQE